MNCPKCKAPQGNGNTIGESLNMGYGRCLSIHFCEECWQKWVVNPISGYLNIPTGVLMKYKDRWIPESVFNRCLIVDDGTQLFPWLRYCTRTCPKCKTSCVRKTYTQVEDLAGCHCADFESVLFAPPWQRVDETDKVLVIWQEEALWK